MALRGMGMGFRRRGRLGEETAERLLDAAAGASRTVRPSAGDAPDRRPGDEPASPLTALLSAAAAPARPGELGGEDAALAAFRAARPDRRATGAPTVSPVPDRLTADGGAAWRGWWSGPRPRRRPTLGATAWAAAAVVTVTMGVALAADLGIPASTPPAGPAPVTASADTSAPVPTTPASTPSTAARTGPTGTPGTAPNPAGQPPPSIRGKCRSYLARDGAASGKPPVTELVAAAGGPERVGAYCRALLDSDTGNGNGNGNGKPKDKDKDKDKDKK
ncbi:hypothetical protein [Plantactinospora sp. B24E8]|uniref:hypothetical protein n=1 Tax=Plantactinospora sp. B24E8 TaxID=3153567 RepID=UPI00325C6790